MKRSKVLIVTDDGIDSEFLFTPSKVDYVRLSFDKNKSGNGSRTTTQDKIYGFNEFSEGHYLTNMYPVNAMECMLTKFGPIDFVFVGPNKGFNLGPKANLSSSSIAMAKVALIHGVGAMVVSLGFDVRKLTKEGNDFLEKLMLDFMKQKFYDRVLSLSIFAKNLRSIKKCHITIGPVVGADYNSLLYVLDYASKSVEVLTTTLNPKLKYGSNSIVFSLI